jgi:hypothetical protein
MILVVIIQATKLARFVKEVWLETQRLRRTFRGPSEE